MNTFLGHLLHQRLGQTRLHCLALGQALAQVSAQAAQLRHAGDDAGLFGEGGSGIGTKRTFSAFKLSTTAPEAEAANTLRINREDKSV